MKSKMNTARIQKEAKNYVKDGSFLLEGSHDRFLYERTTRTAKPKSNSSSGGGSSSRGSSSGGRGGGRF